MRDQFPDELEPWEPLPPELVPLENFVCYLLRELGLVEQDGGPTKQQLSIADWQENGPNRKITVGFRGVAKSTLAAFKGLRRLRIDPFNEKVLIAGCTAEKAVEITTFMQRCMRDVDILRCLMPKSRGMRKSVRAFDVGPSIVDQSPSVRAVGILSPALTGKRCTYALADDIETLSNSITPLKQARLADAITELEAILKPDQGQELPRGIDFLGTPHLETSIYLKLARERNYAIRYWPARYPDPNDPEQIDCYEGNLDPTMLAEVLEHPELVGQPTDPERFPHEDLLARELSMTPASVQLQFQLNTRLSTLNKYPLRLGDLIVMDLDGKALPEVVGWGSSPSQRIQDLHCVGLGADRYYHRPAMVGTWMQVRQLEENTKRREQDPLLRLMETAPFWRCGLFVDPSGRGRDELAWCVVAEFNGNFFLLDEGGTQEGYEERVLQLLAERAKRWSCNICETEANYGDGMFAAILQPAMSKVHPLTVADRKVGNLQKERRIADTLAPVLQQHRLVVSSEVIRRSWEEAEKDPESGHERSLFTQISRLTTERGALEWDDRVDVLSFAISHFTESAKQDQERQAQERQRAIEDATFAAWFDETGASIDALAMGLVGSPAMGPQWPGARSYGGGVRPRPLIPQGGQGRRVVREEPDAGTGPLSASRPDPRSSGGLPLAPGRRSIAGSRRAR